MNSQERSGLYVLNLGLMELGYTYTHTDTYTNNGKLCSRKKREILPRAIQMDLEGIMVS